MIESNFSSSECAKSVGFSGSQFKTVVEALHDAAGNRLPGPKPVEQKLSVGAQHARHLLHGFDLRAHHALAPKVEKLSSPEGGDIIPEELKVLLQQVAAHRLQVVAQEIAQFDFLFGGQILRSFEQAPTGMGEDGSQPLRPQFSCLLRPNFVDGLVHMHGDVKAVQDMDSLAGLPGDDPEVGFPHIATDEEQLSRPFLAKGPEKAQQGFNGSVFPYPQQALALGVDLVDDREVLVTSLPENLIHSDRLHIRQVPMRQAPQDRPFNGSEDLLPGRAEADSDLFPGKLFSPDCQKLHVGFRQGVFPIRPRHPFDLHATPLAVDPPQGINEKHCDVPERNELKHPRRQGIVAGARTSAAGANRLTVGSRQDLDQQCQVLVGIQPDNVAVHKRLELLDPIQNSLELHPGFLSCWIFACQSYPIQDCGQDALGYSSPSPFAAFLCNAFPLFSKALKERDPSRACGKCGIFRQAIRHFVVTHKFH
jgi:hypothetical protein